MRPGMSSWLSMFALLACTQAPVSSTPAPVSTAPAPTPAPATGAPAQSAVSAEQAARNDSLRRDRQMHVNRILEQIKGKEDLPSEDVFQNIKILQNVPARRLLGMMSGGYSNSLGVSCSHCHVTTDFGKDDKPTKQIARDMVAMVRVINDTLLKRIPNIKSENPGVNCGTCHDGTARPGFGPQQRPRS